MSQKYYPTIGLEIHAELATKSKMFCGCLNNPDETTPNFNVCAVCTAQPGAIPAANQKAIESMVKIGLAVDGTIANYSEFDRKNYFYPDIPKGYQISQFAYPIVSGGTLRGVELERIHLEEDTGTNKHDQGDFSLVDYNRAGVPLMELVTKPVIHDAQTAGSFAKELQQLLRYLGVGHANMEKGEMRVEVNVSISTDPNKLGTKVEVKNLSSFRVVEKAIDYEIQRMSKLFDEGRQDEIVMETRGWDDNKGRTFSQRKKETSADYRYFPDPDLPKMYLHEIFDLDTIKAELPELPAEKRSRYQADFGIKDEDIETYITQPHVGVFFENVIIAFPKDKDKIKLASNYITSDLMGMQVIGQSFTHPNPSSFAKLINMVSDGQVNSRGAKDLLALLVEEDRDPQELAKEKGLIQQNDQGAILAFVDQAIADNPKAVEDYKNGKETAVKFLLGQVMRHSKGSANPTTAQKLIVQQLDKA